MIEITCAICKKVLLCKNEENAKKRGWKIYDGDWGDYRGKWFCDKCDIIEGDEIVIPTPYIFPLDEYSVRKRRRIEERIRKKKKRRNFNERGHKDFFSSGGVTRRVRR